MKSLDQRLSEITSPFDEVEMDQDELLQHQHLLYQKESILNSIGTEREKIEFDLHFEEIQEQLEPEEYQEFIKQCLKRLTETYYLDELYDWIDRNGLIDNHTEQVSNLIKYFIHSDWLQDLAFCFPEISIQTITDLKKIEEIITATFSEIKNKIKIREDINPLVRLYFNNCSMQNGVKTILKLVFSDLPGIISVQLVKNQI